MVKKDDMKESVPYWIVSFEIPRMIVLSGRTAYEKNGDHCEESDRVALSRCFFRLPPGEVYLGKVCLFLLDVEQAP